MLCIAIDAMVLSKDRRDACMEAMEALENLGWKVEDYNQTQDGGTIRLGIEVKKND